MDQLSPKMVHIAFFLRIFPISSLQVQAVILNTVVRMNNRAKWELILGNGNYVILILDVVSYEFYKLFNFRKSFFHMFTFSSSVLLL